MATAPDRDRPPAAVVLLGGCDLERPLREEIRLVCHTLFAEIWKDPTAQKNGRRGEAQHGVDVWGRLADGAWVAVQCKGKDSYADKAVTADELRTEVKKALGFDQKLTHWILATSGPKRGTIEALAREITTEHEAEGLFGVQVVGWDDLLPLIGSHEKVIEKHFPDVAPRNRLMAEQVGDIHAFLFDPSRMGQPISPGQLLAGSKTPSAPEEAFTPSEAERVRRILGAKSSTLLRWPRTTAGRWLDRPELGTMLAHLARPKVPPIVLLGPPGSGKSALMARLGEELASRGVTLLAIKADTVRREVTSLAGLQAEFEMPGPLDECLGQRFYLATALRGGSLFEPFETCLRRRAGYDLVCAPGRAAEPAITASWEWMVGRAKEEAAAHG